MLTVVVTIVDGGPALERCLEALARNHAEQPLRAIVPWDDSVQGIPPLTDRFPFAQFPALGPLPTLRPAESSAGAHERYDRRRAAGLARAVDSGAELIAIVQDRSAPAPGWARAAVEAHAAAPHAVIGGAVAHVGRGVLNWAVYFCDYGRYQPPLEAGPRAFVTDVNVVYKRHALEGTRELWRERYHETTVHWALQRAGATLWLDPRLVVEERRDGLRLGTLLRERVDWARLFAYTRARELPLSRRLALAALTPALPLLLLARQWRLQQGKPTHGTWWRVCPVTLLLLIAWSVGEAQAYLTAEP